MDINDIIKAADEAYCEHEGVIASYWNPKMRTWKDSGDGDTLAKFIAIEISETYDAEASDADQLETAAHCVDRASTECISVAQALYARMEEAMASPGGTVPNGKGAGVRARQEARRAARAGQRALLAERAQQVVNHLLGEQG